MKKKTARLTLPQEAIERTKQVKTEFFLKKTENTHRYEQKCQSHAYSGAITVVCMIMT
jgi:hypothetical protein